MRYIIGIYTCIILLCRHRDAFLTICLFTLQLRLSFYSVPDLKIAVIKIQKSILHDIVKPNRQLMAAFYNHQPLKPQKL